MLEMAPSFDPKHLQPTMPLKPFLTHYCAIHNTTASAAHFGSTLTTSHSTRLLTPPSPSSHPISTLYRVCSHPGQWCRVASVPL